VIGALPLCCASADEPIPPLSDRRWVGPDMRNVTPVSVMLAELAHVRDDAVAYIDLLVAFTTEIGCMLTADYDRDGSLGLRAGYPCDAQARHRNRWMHFLIRDLDSIEGRREELQDVLVAAGRYIDQRPVDPGTVTRALRDALRAGFRVMLRPDGQIETGGDNRILVDGHRADVVERKRALRAYSAASRRPRAHKHIVRAIRLLGRRTDNGWLVLEGRAA
jgi:hypothetical protein